MTIDVHKVFANYFDTENAFRAAIYAVSQKLEQGHVCLDITAYNDTLDTSITDSNPFLEKNKKLDIAGISNNKLVEYSLEKNRPFIFQNGKLYLQRYFNYQSLIHQKLEAFVTRHPLSDTNTNFNEIHKELDRLFPVNDEVDWQKIAALSALMNHFTIISGGPGTGKTTTVAKILALLYLQNPDLKVALCAPTGKAAARMNESLTKSKSYLNLSPKINEAFEQIQVSTIQRLLGYQRNSIYFRYNKDNLLPYDLIIVDEASMISASLISKLLQAVSTEKKIILLGDKYQLASIEAGSIFGDMCNSVSSENIFSKKRYETILKYAKLPSSSLFHSIKTKTHPLLLDHIITLQKSYRFDTNKGIGKLAKEILNNEIDISSLKTPPTNQTEFAYFTNNYEHPSLNKYIAKYKEYIQESDIKKAFDLMNKVRILCAVKEGKSGVYHYNKYIENYLVKKKLIQVKEGFYENQPIIITKNDYTHNLFNGDIGIVRRDEHDRLRAFFEDPSEGFRSVSTAVIESYETVFAMTIHKSQGSEFDHVVIILPAVVNENILSRQLLYTAVTRAKKEVLIIGSDEQLQNAASNKIQRASGLAELLILNANS